MRILFIHWNSYGNEDIIYHFKAQKHKVVIFPITGSFGPSEYPRLENALIHQLSEDHFDFIFSFNYYPFISNAAMSANIKYAAWVYDNPFIQLFSNTLSNPCNRVFLFDKTLYLDLRSRGFTTVYFLPLAANTERYDTMLPVKHIIEKYTSDVSFVGSLYTDPKNDLYSRFTGLSDYTRGYLESLMECQKRIYGYFFLPQALTEKVLTDMILSCPVAPSEDGFEDVVWIYSNYFLARKITAMERQEILSLLPPRYHCVLYTKDSVPAMQNLEKRGQIDYYTQMPYVFKCSKINLNITLRSIQSGIPLRAMDIMGCGGFLLTNFQADLLDFFEPGRDFVFYEDYEDLLAKIDYYLKHEEERKLIARNGCQKVVSSHTYSHRIREIIEVIQE